MAERPQPYKPVLQKPPGYRDPTLPVHTAPRPPARKPVLPPSFPTKRKRRSCCRICCCFLCILVFLLLLILLVGGGLFYLWFEPKLPAFHLQSLQMPQFNVTVKPDGTYLNAQTVVRVEAKNPNNKITLHYGPSDLQLSDGEEEDDTNLGSASLPGFTQSKQNSTVLKFTTRVKGMVDDGWGTRLKARYRRKTLVVSAEVQTRIGLGVERWRMGTVGVNVLCGDITLKQLSGGAMPKCTINLLKW